MKIKKIAQILCGLLLVDVYKRQAMMCKLGFDIKLADMSKDDETQCRTAVQNYNRLKPVVLEGDM